MTAARETSQSAAEAEVVQLCSDLIQIDSVNTGDLETIGDGETRACRYIEQKLQEVGYETTFLESVPGRGNVICRLAGADDKRGALLIHGHVDVVPANSAEWTVDPFSGAVQDGYVWGRGAVDMKDMVAMMLAVARDFKRHHVVPPRDLIFAFMSDEEAGGYFGARWLVDNHPDLFDGATEAISEVGGFSISLDETRRAYLVAAAEKGIAWATLHATGTAGHGSMINDDNAVTRIASAVARLGAYEFPLVRTATVDAFLAAVTDLTGLEFPDEDFDGAIGKIGPVSRIVRSTLRNTANPTMLKAGYKANVIPSEATATVDCRIVPGSEETFRKQVAEIVGDGIAVEWVWQPPIEFPFEGDFVEKMKAALTAEDPHGTAIPYMLSGGTDNKAFAPLGVRGYGFAPLRLPPDLDFSSLFHGVDERVPVDALTFGVRVLDRLFPDLLKHLWRYRSATEADWPGIWRIFRQIVLAGETYAYDPDWTSEEAQRVWMEEPPGRAVVAVDGESILGTAKTGPNRPGRGAHVATASFMVSDRARGRGVGRALAEDAIGWARRAGYRSMQFNAVVETNVAAVALWKSLGFCIIGTVPEAFAHPTLGYVGLHVMYLKL